MTDSSSMRRCSREFGKSMADTCPKIEKCQQMLKEWLRKQCAVELRNAFEF